MKVYTNSPLNISIEDNDDVKEYYETYVYTRHGIYQKYKKHFFLCEKETSKVSTKVINHENKQYLVEENSLKLNKQKILTSLPYQSYFVNTFIRKCSLDNGIAFVKEIDNDHFESFYFIVDDIEKIKSIGLYVK